MQFPHLADTQFPDLSTVNVYQFQNTFDYTRWNEKTKIKLCNVLWNSSYSDVVKFDTDLIRDTWFNSLDIMSVELLTSARIVPDGSIKLPIPYDVLARYNYLFVDMPIATDSQHKIDYETATGIRRWYFFIEDIRYLSPNATQAFLSLDVWTNFQNKIEIPYMLLERGHAPVSVSDVDDYLENPIANNKYLLAPDVNFDNAGITRSSSYVPFGNGTKYVCFASTCSASQVASLGTVTTDSSYNPVSTITYSDTVDRFGYQLEVHGLSFGNGRDYSNARTPASVGVANGNRIANNLTVYAIAASNVYGANATFFQDLITKCPQFLTTVKGCFVVDENCITLSTSTYTIAGHTLYTCVGKSQSLLTKALDKSDFDYPEELQRFAKLYTAPYAKLEITDNSGTTFEVNIEETSTLTVESVVSVAFPYINERVYVDGIGGIGSESYAWVDLQGNSSSLSMQNSDWLKYCFDWKIPTFALYMDGETAFMLETFNRNVKQAIQQSLVNYHNTMRSANTAYENACDTADVAYENTTDNAATARDNSYRSADTAKTNSYNSAATSYTNSVNIANTANTNAYNTADTAYTNAENSAITIYDNTDRSCTTARENLDFGNAAIADNEEDAMLAEIEIAGIDAITQDALTQNANSATIHTAAANVEAATATAMYSAIGGLVGGTASSAAAGAAYGPVGAGAGAAAGAISGIVNAVVTNIQNGIVADTSIQVSDLQANANTAAKDITVGATIRGIAYLPNTITSVKTDTRTGIYQRNILASENQMDNTNQCTMDNADDTKDTTLTNAQNSKDTAETNADNTQNTALTNAQNSRDTAEDNADNTNTTSRANASDTYDITELTADRTRDNVQANAGYTHDVAVLNAKEILENGKYAAMAAISDAKNSAPIECCPYSGNPGPDYMQTRGVQIKVKTQSDSAIKQTGDVFARFGYTLNQIWDVATSGLKLMNYFTYWKASEIWVNDKENSNNAINTFIKKIFLKGVTVWNDPTKIGAVNVYAN